MKHHISLIAAALVASMSIGACGNAVPAATVSQAAETAPAVSETKVLETEADTSAAETEAASPAGEMRDITTMELVHEMGFGINLGNTMEACGDWVDSSNGVRGYETCWGSPVITREIIEGYKNAGFGVLRVPVAWSNLMEEDYTISAELMSRVQEIVGWALDSGLYVVMNIHWDGGWFENFPTDKENCMKKYTRVWEQICDNFRDYSDYLMFESLNEEGGWDSVWNRYGGGTEEQKQESFGLLNEMNQNFVDIVRKSGGNNAKRHLLIAGYNTDIDLTCDSAYKMPNDPENRCAVSVHYYTPSTFCLLDKDADWGKARKKWGGTGDIRVMNEELDLLKTTYIDKGIPVIVGEYGCVAIKNKEPEQILNFNKTTAKAMWDRGMCPVLWDVTNCFYDRTTCKLKDPDFEKAINEISSSPREMF